jgi:hypothetical protein
VSAHIWDAYPLVRLVTSADGSALATVLITISPDVFARDLHHSTSRFQSTTSRTRPTWSLVKLSGFWLIVDKRGSSKINRGGRAVDFVYHDGLIVIGKSDRWVVARVADCTKYHQECIQIIIRIMSFIGDWDMKLSSFK